MNKVKTFALIVALKRKKRNSKILKKAKYKLAADFGIHPTTFCKLIKSAISEGWVEEIGNYYHIKKFTEIVKEFCLSEGFEFGFHEILGENKQHRHEETSIKEITNQIYSKLILDNVVKPQEYYTLFSSKFQSKNKKTVTKAYRDLGRIFSNRIDDMEKCADGFMRNPTFEQKMETINQDITTSARHTAKKLKISSSKASKVLNLSKDIKRVIKVEWRALFNSFEQLDSIRREFPYASVIPFPHYGLIKICHGSILSRV